MDILHYFTLQSLHGILDVSCVHEEIGSACRSTTSREKLKDIVKVCTEFQKSASTQQLCTNNCHCPNKQENNAHTHLVELHSMQLHSKVDCKWTPALAPHWFNYENPHLWGFNTSSSWRLQLRNCAMNITCKLWWSYQARWSLIRWNECIWRN